MDFGPIRLDDLYKTVAHTYSEQNAQRPARETFAHFVEICGMLASHDRQKNLEGLKFEDALCKALAWFFPLLAKFKVASVEELVFRKFPYACPYCREKPHADAKCKTIRGTSRTVDHDALRKLYIRNSILRPVTLNDWGKMFQEIYPRSTEDRPARSTLGLLEELGELAEAVRVFDRYPKYFAGEAADVFSYIMGLANEHALRVERESNRVFSFEEEFVTRYPGLCVHCGYPVCVCPYIPEATVGRLSKELDLAPVDDLFHYDEESFHRETASIAMKLFERLGGYAGLLQTFPFDRGETNKALVMLCFNLAEALQEQNGEVAQRLRSAAISIGTAATYAGSRQKPSNVENMVRSIQNALSEVGGYLRNIIVPDDVSLPGQLTRLLRPKACRVLLVFANPKDSTNLRLAEEERAIREAIALSRGRDSVELRVLPAATVDDLRRSLLNEVYQILHFSGHGEPGGLTFETPQGKSQQSPLKALAEFVELQSGIECVILNACWSLKDFDVPVGRFTVGMEAPVNDEAAIEFARGFYDALGAGQSWDLAIEHGRIAAAMKNRDLPIKVLRKKDEGVATVRVR